MSDTDDNAIARVTDDALPLGVDGSAMPVPWDTAADGPYREHRGGIERKASRGNDEVQWERLTNWQARVAAEVTHDYGEGITENAFAVRGRLAKREEEREMPASEFDAPRKWSLALLGAGARTENSPREEWIVQDAIQRLSGSIPRRTVKRHTGWCDVSEGRQPVYLHANGAIATDTPPDLETALAGRAADVALPDPRAASPAEIREAVIASRSLLACAADPVAMPVFASIWLAAIGRQRLCVWLVGRRESYKTWLASLAMAHFGEAFLAEGRPNPPANWSSTENAIEGAGFVFRDALYLIDDWKPPASRFKADAYAAAADRIVRNFYNGAGRARMKRDGSMDRERAIRAGALLVTGEAVPPGESLRSRMVIVATRRELIRTGQVRESRLLVPRFPLAIAAFIRWLARGRIDRVRQQLVARAQQTDAAVNRAGLENARARCNLALLTGALSVWSDFAVDVGAIGVEEAAAIVESSESAADHLADEQDRTAMQEDPVELFRSLLAAAFVSGGAFVEPADETDSALPERLALFGRKRDGPCIGWANAATTGDALDQLWLIPEMAHRVVVDGAQRSGAAFALDRDTLLARLLESDSLLTHEEKRSTVRRRVRGRRVRVIVVSADWVMDADRDDSSSATAETEVDRV